MKRTDINLSNEIIIAYCKKVHARQSRTYTRMVATGTLPELTAKVQMLIITEWMEMARQLEQKGYNWKEAKQLLQKLPGKKIVRSNKLF